MEKLYPLRIAVNVSAAQLNNPSFIEEICQAIVDTECTASALELEITKSLFMQDAAHAIDVLDQLTRLGITIAIDDFGTGYSSLSYLSRLPVDSLKIDRSFISSMVDNPDNMAIVSTIISLAHSLTLRVVAEGVETAETAKFLRLLRCDDMQGFYFCPPVPKDKVAGWLKNRNEPLQKPSLS